MTLEVAEFHSPIGTIMLAVRDGALAALVFAEGWPDGRVRLVKRFGEIGRASCRERV